MREFYALAFLALSCIRADAACTMLGPDNKTYSAAIGDSVCVPSGSSGGALMRCVFQGSVEGFKFVQRCPFTAGPRLPSSTEKPLRDGDVHPFWNCVSSSRTGGNSYDEGLLIQCLSSVLSQAQLQAFRTCVANRNTYNRCYDTARLL